LKKRKGIISIEKYDEKKLHIKIKNKWKTNKMKKVSIGIERSKPLGHQAPHIRSLNWIDWDSASCNSAPDIY
jgi:hypothetical protein